MASVVVPNKIFLIGAIGGYNTAARTFNKDYVHSATPPKSYMGHWLHLECEKCGRFFAYDNPNDLQLENLVCETCGNIVIQYGVLEVNQWKIGPIEIRL